MLVATPFIDLGSKRVVDFYKGLLSAQGIKTRAIQVSPFSDQGDFAVSQVDVTAYFDIGNKGLGNITAAGVVSYTGSKSVYHGNLLLNTYFVNGVSGAVDTTNWLVDGDNSALTSWAFKHRVNTAVVSGQEEYNVKGSDNFIDDFQGVIFRFLRKNVNSAIGHTEQTEWKFSGLRIDFQ